MKKKELIAEIENQSNIIESLNLKIRELINQNIKEAENEKWKVIDDFKDNIAKVGGSNVNMTMEHQRGCEGVKRYFKLEFEL